MSTGCLHNQQCVSSLSMRALSLSRRAPLVLRGLPLGWGLIFMCGPLVCGDGGVTGGVVCASRGGAACGGAVVLGMGPGRVLVVPAPLPCRPVGG